MIETDGLARVRPTSGEASFQPGDVFFSRTDKRGVIQAANDVFCRVANHDWATLSGAPHKIIRHPDMPRGLFHLIWETLEAGEMLGAYVKNRSSDGLHHWVFAVMVPTGDGYLSARIKPSSPLLEKVADIYRRQRRLEDTTLQDPAGSADWLLGELAVLGYADYGRFMSHALGEELVSRDGTLNLPENEAIVRCREMQKAADGLRHETDGLVKEFELTEIIPHNMRVIASRLEPNGGPISTLSTNYGAMSREMSTWFETNVIGENSNFSTIKDTVASSMFLHCTSRILMQCAAQLDRQKIELDGVDIAAERDRLAALAAQVNLRADAGQNKVAEETCRILEACRKMNRHMLGLSTTRVMCKIEGARLTEGRESLTDIIGELNGFQGRIRSKLSRIEELSGTIRGLLN